MEDSGGGGDNNIEEDKEALMIPVVVASAGYRFQNVEKLSPTIWKPARKIIRLFAVAAAVVVACSLLYRSTEDFRPFSLSSSLRFFLPSINSEQTDLENVLQKAAMAKKTVIITTLNEAWAVQNCIFELFLESFRIGNGTQWLLNHLIVVALDHKAYDLCLNLHPNCFHLQTVNYNFSREAYFMTSDYLKMMWRRMYFLHTVLDLGYNFIFTDVDIMWFRDPFPHFFPESDFQIACDYFKDDPSDLNNAPNGGFTYVKSNKKTKKFYEFWYKSKDVYPGKHDQDVLNEIKHDAFIKKIGLKIKFLDTAYFGGFCEPSKDLNLVVTMHANCCAGLDNKIYDLKILLEDWRKYVTKSRNKTSPASSWMVPQHCGYFHFPCARYYKFLE